MIGRTVGRYRIVGKLGEGGMGSVWKARDELLSRAVAIKFLPEAAAVSSEARQRFLRGARAAAELDHPGIAAIYDAGEADGLLYVAGALVRGRTVREKVARGPLPVPEAVRIARETAAALAHAHAHGIIHRDISGGNIMVRRDGRVAVLDFGLAKPKRRGTAKVTRSGVAVGTVAYMSPEVALGRTADARSDVYGLGAVLYEMLTGSPPYGADQPEAILYRALHEPLKRPARGRRALPPRLTRILCRALAKDPEGRYPGAGALMADLDALAAEKKRARGCHPPRLRMQPAAPARATRRTRRVPRARSTPGSLPEQRVLLVLPFRALAAGGAEDHGIHALARGLAETLSARLSRAAGGQVVSPAAAPAGQAPTADSRDLAHAHGATLVLHGTLQRSGARVRVAWSLVRAADGVQIEGGAVDGNARDLLALEDRLLRGVVEALEPEATVSRPRAPEPGADPAAREHFLQALGHLQRHGDEVSVDGAIRLLERLSAGDSGTARVWAALGRACFAKHRLTLERDWLDRGRAACERALELDPGSPEALVTLGHLHNARGRHASAARVLRRALGTRRDDLDAILALADAYEGMGRHDDAERTCREAIALRPTYWGGYNRLGALQFRLGRYDEAARHFRRVVEVAPDSARGYSNLGSAYFHLSRWEDAMGAFRRSLDLQPNASAFTSLGTVQFFLGRYEQAAGSFEKGAALRPFDPMQWGNLADAYRWMAGGEEKSALAYEQAIRLAREQLALRPGEGRTWVRLAAWLAKRGRPREAARALRRGLRLAPHDVGSVVHAVTVHELAGEREKALEWLERAVALGYDRAELERDPELVSLREDPAFRRIIQENQAV